MRIAQKIVVLGIVAVGTLVGCSGDKAGEDAASGEQFSTANSVDCDVDYDTLAVYRLVGVKVEEPTDRPISLKEKTRHLNELNATPDAFVEVLRMQKVPIKLTGGSVTNFSEFARLKGIQPPGWEGTEFTWDDIPGTGTRDGIFLGDSAKPNNAWSLAVHEGMHAVDDAVQLTATSTELKALYEAELRRPINDADENAVYRRSDIREFIAVAADEFVCNAATRSRLRSRYPDLFAYVRNKLDGELRERLPAPVTPATTGEAPGAVTGEPWAETERLDGRRLGFR